MEGMKGMEGMDQKCRIEEEAVASDADLHLVKIRGCLIFH
jgi:hypothetical protein